MKIIIKGKEHEFQEGNTIRKWSPILEQLHEVDTTKRDIDKFMSLYAEIHNITDQQYSVHDGNITNPGDGSLLPISMKLLSKLHLQGKELIITTNENHIEEFLLFYHFFQFLLLCMN